MAGQRLLRGHHVVEIRVGIDLVALVGAAIGPHLIGENTAAILLGGFPIRLVTGEGIGEVGEQIVPRPLVFAAGPNQRRFGRDDVAAVVVEDRKRNADLQADNRGEGRRRVVVLDDRIGVDVRANRRDPRQLELILRLATAFWAVTRSVCVRKICSRAAS